MLSRQDVIDFATEGHVFPAPNFHGRSAHGATFEKLATQLLFTVKVRKDPRPEHPDGYIAFTRNWGNEVYRVDFNLVKQEDGQQIVIVTGWRIGE